MEAGTPVEYKANAGLGAKVILSTSMNLDVIVNPDYSQVEVDRQVTNLDRFELYFPEKRKFFLENSDLFANLGTNLDITFTDKLFLSTFVQYNNQIDNINMNMRFQWRFAPVSDLFIVYAENAYPGAW
ncbi:MAG: DUF5916 domain-containing protein [Bacteroidales bacterium]|nr:DUF5916 domain-containing protein [Bacteroidales bacterium]